uniref:Uncharacterized protein n=1 Tax=Labrus bergylta TaxID=56723 RepID=A0A3Q3ET92_9LABR
MFSTNAVVKKGLEFGTGKPTNTTDRPGKASAKNSYAAAVDRTDDGVMYAGAGWGHARAEWRMFDAEAKGPNASVGAEFTDESFKAMAKAEVATDTGVGIGKSGVEAKFLGTGFSIGRKTGFSLFGSGFELIFQNGSFEPNTAHCDCSICLTSKSVESITVFIYCKQP